MRRIVVLRHGILINRFFMMPMARYFRRRGYVVHNRSYRSTRKTIEEHAWDLAEEIKELQRQQERTGEPFELYAVTHSLGGLVLRHALTHFSVPPIRRAVQLVPPNQGSQTARSLSRLRLYRWIGGKTGGQLAEEPPGIFAECGVPENIEMGIIAGVNGWKLLPIRLERPHDGVVAREETRLAEFSLKELPHNHTLILFRRRAFEEAAHFLEHGVFR